jgi:hypothetical protein
MYVQIIIIYKIKPIIGPVFQLALEYLIDLLIMLQ